MSHLASYWKGGLTGLTVLRSRCPARTIVAARVTFLTYKKKEWRMTFLYLSLCWPPMFENHIKNEKLRFALRTAWVVTGHWELHGWLALHVDDVIPLYRFHVAQLLTWEPNSSVQNLCKSKSACHTTFHSKLGLAGVLDLCCLCGLTRQAVQEKLSGALTGGLVNIGEHWQSKLLLHECVAADDAQVIEGNGAHLVESDEDVAAHFFDGLREKMKVSKK